VFDWLPYDLIQLNRARVAVISAVLGKKLSFDACK
jgi:hypothetical protein